MDQIDEELLPFAFEALQLGFDCISDGDHDPFVLLVDSDGERHFVELHAASGAIGPSLVDGGRDVIRAFTKGQIYGLVWDGYLTIDDVKHDAVFVEAGKRADKTAYVLAQKYKQNARSKALKMDGRPILVEDAKHLWKAPKSRIRKKKSR
jgi:hypothetical protein